MDPNEERQEDGFNVLSGLITFATEIFENQKNELYTLFNNGLGSKNPKLKLSSVKAFGSYIEVLEFKNLKDFEPLLLNMLEAVYTILEVDEELG